MNALEGLKLVETTARGELWSWPWFRLVDADGEIVGSGFDPDEARQTAEREVRRRRERHQPGVLR